MSEPVKNPFKVLFKDEELPEEQKAEFLRALEAVKLVGEVIEMFSVVQGQVDMDIIDTIVDPTRGKNKKKEDK